MMQFHNFIGGRWQKPVNGIWCDNPEPATGLPFSQWPDSGTEDVAAAVSSAREAFPSWSAMSADERSHWLMVLSDGIQEKLEAFAQAESQDNGKPVALARTVDIPRAIANFKFFAQAITQFSSESHSMGAEGINYTLRQPIGVVACISPWNLPLYLLTWKIAPALAAGNTVVAKPSEMTPYTAHLLAELCIEKGFPPGVLNLVHGKGASAGEAICRHPLVKAISFTGGTATGKRIAGIAAPAFKKMSLELGGKNPTIIFADCDYEAMLSHTVRSSFANQGQICLCGSRIFIERSIYEKFKADFVQKVSGLHPADPSDPSTRFGALVSEAHMEKVLGYIQLAKEEGGTVLTGGKRVLLEGRCRNGWFVQPTVLEGLPFDCRTNQEEIFGPVVTLTPFDSEEEVLKQANSTEYGLSAVIWTENLSRAHSLSARLEAGIVWVNCWLVRDLRTPFGGVKSSGVGREGGLEVLRFFTEPKNVCIRYGA